MSNDKLHAQLVALSSQIGKMQARFLELKDLARRRGSSSEKVTVYQVAETRVRAYNRGGFVAVRVRN